MNLVIDASVLVKWLLKNSQREQDTELATTVMTRTMRGEFELLQPPHWIAEVGAVMSRLSPRTAAEDIQLLCLLDIEISATESDYRRACSLSVSLHHHLFDTLYHAVALENEATLVTADETYWRK